MKRREPTRTALPGYVRVLLVVYERPCINADRVSIASVRILYVPLVLDVAVAVLNRVPGATF